MRSGRIVPTLGLILAGFLMGHTVDAGVTHDWPGWERDLWAVTLVGAVIAGVLLLLNGLGVLTTETLNSPSLSSRTEESKLTVGTFVSVYVGILVVAVGSGLVLEERTGISADRTILAVCGAIFLVAASGRPWWLYATLRRIR
jgi:hypothetical protein